MTSKLNRITLRPGDLAQVRGTSRKWVALNVTTKDMRRGMSVRQPGLHLFGGYWYASESMGGPLRHGAYGKLIEPGTGARMLVVGRVRTHYASSRHCR